jgi:hypothetical protein
MAELPVHFQRRAFQVPGQPEDQALVNTATLPLWRCSAVHKGIRCDVTARGQTAAEAGMKWAGGRLLCPGCHLRQRVKAHASAPRAGRSRKSSLRVDGL